MRFITRVLAISIILVVSLSAVSAKRIVSLVPSITEAIVALEADEQLVGITSFCRTERAKDAEIVASAVEANVEKILMLKPDIVYVSSLVKQQNVTSMRRLGLNVVNIETPRSFAEICSQFEQIAKDTEKEDAAKIIIKEQRMRLTELAQKQNEAKPKVFFQIGSNPIFAVIPNTFMNDMITIAGGINIASQLEHGTMSREAVLVRNPDCIFIVDMGLVSSDEAKVWYQYETLNAVKQKRIFVIDQYMACSPTPKNFVDTVEFMISKMY